MTMVPKVIVKFISPIVMTLGAYVVLHGHLSPGGGFQGGVILGGVAALVFLVFGADAVLHRFNLEKYTPRRKVEHRDHVVTRSKSWFFASFLWKGAYPTHYASPLNQIDVLNH